MKTKPYIVHVISHTHWDREWYLTFQQYRQRLVDLVDHLLEILDKDPEYKYFHLDGQTIILEDYLEIRPENEAKLKKYVQEGRILIGPFYTLPDYFLISNESFVRNLLKGIKMAKDFSGGKWMKVGYSPDSFGNLSQFPQVLKGFGIDYAIFGRWIDVRKSNAEFWWESPDGSRVLAHFMHCWYNNLQRFGTDVDKALEMTHTAIERLIPYTTTNQLVFMNGVDHLEPQKDMSSIIKAINKKLKNVVLIHSTLPEFFEACKKNNHKLKTFRQEMREGDDGALIPGVLSSRIYLKHQNHQCQTLLEKWVEPISLFAERWTTQSYPKTSIDLAWKHLLQNHPHDSICGCSIDPVHRDMLYRFAQTSQIGEDLLERRLTAITKTINTRDFEDHSVGVVIFNPSDHVRTEVIETKVFFQNWKEAHYLELIDEKGTSIPFTVLHQRVTHRCQLHPVELPKGVKSTEFTIALTAKEIPGFGYKTYQAIAHAKPIHPQTGLLVPSEHILENQYLKIQIESNGSLTITHKQLGKTFKDMLVFEDGGDNGDSYNYEAPVRDRIYTTASLAPDIALIENSHLRAKYRIEYSWSLPESLDDQHHQRSNKVRRLGLAVEISLTPTSRHLLCEATIDNQLKDHRLRVLFPSDIAADEFHSDSVFDVVTRPIASMELPPTSCMRRTHVFPQQSFTSVNHKQVGLSILSVAQPEVEVKEDSRRTIAITLVRSVGWWARNWGGTPGEPISHPNDWSDTGKAVESQTQGIHHFKFAIYPHKGNWIDASVMEFAQDLGNPLRAWVTEKHTGTLPLKEQFLTIKKSPVVIVSALKKSEDGKSSIVRFFNPGNKSENVTMTPLQTIRKAQVTNLNEELEKELPIRNNTIRFTVQGKKIITIAFH